jgi:hypothetical protein
MTLCEYLTFNIRMSVFVPDEHVQCSGPQAGWVVASVSEGVSE